MKIDSALHEKACRAACTANGLNPDEVISHPYQKESVEPSRPRWEWLSVLCPEIPAIIKVTLEHAKRKSEVA